MRHSCRTLRSAIWIGALAALALPPDIAAQSATAHLAPGQLRIAEKALQGAEEALASGDHTLAARMAAMAQTDARLAWAMTDSEYVRQKAEDINEEAVLLRTESLIRP